jgi:hypothetical protein
VRIVISEFIDDAAVTSLARDFDVRYDAALVARGVAAALVRRGGESAHA